MKFFRWIVLAAALAASMGAHAARSRVTVYHLKNGLELLVKEDNRAPVVVCQVWYKVGSSYETSGLTGVSHALEHMMFDGTKKHPGADFSRIISENGGSENAFTGKDYTAYFEMLEKSRLKVAFELEADRMRNLTLLPSEFDKEIKVVREERRWRTEDSPEAYLDETAMATAFESSPYRQPTIGWMSDLRAMQVSDLRDWYTRWYQPNNATVVVVGDVNPYSVFLLAKHYFGKIKAGPAVTPLYRPEVEQTGIKRIVVKRPARVPSLLMAWKVPVLTSARRDPTGVPEWEPYALEVLSGILAGGDSARFATRLIRGKEVAANLNADYPLNARLESVFTVTGTPAQGHTVEDLENAVDGEIQDLQNHLVDTKELERVKAQVVSQNIYQKDSIFYQAMIIGMLETVGLSWKDAGQYVNRIKAVTAKQVRDVARKFFVDDHLTVAVLQPLPMTPGSKAPPPGGPSGDLR